MLDTHILIWALAEPGRLRPRMRRAVASPSNQVWISAATAWEIAIKHAAGRLTFPVADFDDMLQRTGFEPLAIQPMHAIVAGGLPRLHDDPFDRMLIAQALTERMTLVTMDDRIRAYDVPVLSPDDED